MLSTEAKLTDLVSRMKEYAADNLESIILYGSAARGDHKEGHSDLNVLCVLRSVAARELARVTPVVHWWCKDQNEPAPLFFTAEELRHSADVFSIEMLDMQRSRRVLYGSDVIDGIPVPMNIHRVQVEHDLRTLLLKLRQHFVLTGQKENELRAAEAKSSSSVLALLRHTLIAFEEEPPATAAGSFRAHRRAYRRRRRSLYSRIQTSRPSRARRRHTARLRTILKCPDCGNFRSRQNCSQARVAASRQSRFLSRL